MYKHLYDCFKHWYNLGGTIYFYSDPHFSDEEMKHIRKNYINDEEQIKRINSKVTKKDCLVILGDLGNTDCVKKLKAGYKVLITGNHDIGASKYQRLISKTVVKFNTFEEADEALKRHCIDEIGTSFHEPFIFGNIIEDNHLFDEVYDGTLQISPKIILSHEPVEYKYCFNIHGHDHSNFYQNENSLNVCAENIDYTPVCLKQIIESGKLKAIPDIHRETIDLATVKKLNK